MQHTCHWPDCPRIVPPSLWGCREHWFKLPKSLRVMVWKYYVPGQEITKTPSVEYLAVAALVQGWIAGKVVFNKDGSFSVSEDLQVMVGRVLR